MPQSPAAGAPTTYLRVVGDGDPHTVIRPDTIPPRTPTETLQQIIARDEAPVSAGSLLRKLNNSVRTRARSAAAVEASAGHPTAVLTAAMRLATSSRNGIKSLSTILDGPPSRAAF